MKFKFIQSTVVTLLQLCAHCRSTKNSSSLSVQLKLQNSIPDVKMLKMMFNVTEEEEEEKKTWLQPNTKTVLVSASS